MIIKFNGFGSTPYQLLYMVRNTSVVEFFVIQKFCYCLILPVLSSPKGARRRGRKQSLRTPNCMHPSSHRFWSPEALLLGASRACALQIVCMLRCVFLWTSEALLLGASRACALQIVCMLRCVFLWTSEAELEHSKGCAHDLIFNCVKAICFSKKIIILSLSKDDDSHRRTLRQAQGAY